MADGITGIAVEGFKSIVNRQEIEIAPLTILAGANSSGKSSIMQPLLMLKQTLDAPYDPGALLIDGPHARFTSSDQFVSRTSSSEGRFGVTISTEKSSFTVVFSKAAERGMEVVEESRVVNGVPITLTPMMTPAAIRNFTNKYFMGKHFDDDIFHVGRNRFFLRILAGGIPEIPVMEWIAPYIQNVIHVPGLRGNPARTYRVSGVGPNFEGTFENYVASVILSWQKEQSRCYEDLNCDLQHIGLAASVFAHRVDDTAIEMRVDSDMFSIADVGFGVSQVLPVLVALRAANEGQLVYLEEPEIHLHPRAQIKLADILAAAARRGVRVVAETHSSLLLRAIQTLVANGSLPADLVRLHWFSRSAEGVTHVKSATPDENGAFGDWPEDFGDVALQSEKEYLDAVESKLPR
ncbi:MAG TPA: AAA family ATPase [Bryobacteraceae bacterium]|jgi:predicted ATPase|nr:AAA family ATPase [Bryobacteraceae bacterium]